MEKEFLFTSKEPNSTTAAAATWNSCNFGIEIQPNCFLNPNWENSMDQSDPFESALSSIVSSPVTTSIPTSNGDQVMIRELIGRLGNICNSGEISSPQSYINNNNNSTNTSCYTTPLNSPPKLNISSLLGNHPSLAQFPADPGFVERAAKFSFFGGALNEQMKGNGFKVDGNSNSDNADFGDSREESSLSEQIPGGELRMKSQNNDSNSNARKRKAIPKGKAKETPPPSEAKVVVAEKEEQSAKRSKSEEGNGCAKAKEEEENGKQKQNSNNKENPNPKAAEPPKDYIHVRARRGQATDSHSLAERVRREKISERMKFLQDLVPGCNKVTGKAVMLDEIINYVQSLQRQVEFLSMKLATVNPRMDFNMEAILSKDIFQSRGSMSHSVHPLDSSAALGLPYGYQSQQGVALPNSSGIMSSNAETQFSMNPLNVSALRLNQSVQLPPLDGFGDGTCQVSPFWEDDLQSFVQMGFSQNQHGHMKVEL
ncbi:hypothetical protein JCGZ_13119 [Jatropha curcas]|uniref:BHLH domain-containing protein n=1 Tax=Jatropha curcas TaxID=180498 RepID=A0A067KL80_JATCU|nr:transcription factor bHLH78 isoform X2 [Jatropha curcas]KDP32569.1 hypothetical protein JCGZ_13119 [Jatropha curcas]